MAVVIDVLPGDRLEVEDCKLSIEIGAKTGRRTRLIICAPKATRIKRIKPEPIVKEVAEGER